MRTLLASAFAAAIATASFGVTAAHAASLNIESSPVYWGSTGSYADLVIRVSPFATAPVTVTQFFIADVADAGTTQLIDQCSNATPVKSGDAVVGYTVSPGGWCWYRTSVTGDSIAGHALLTDTTKNTNNITQFVRGSLETRDANNNVLTHVEVH